MHSSFEHALALSCRFDITIEGQTKELPRLFCDWARRYDDKQRIDNDADADAHYDQAGVSDMVRQHEPRNEYGTAHDNRRTKWRRQLANVVHDVEPDQSVHKRQCDRRRQYDSQHACVGDCDNSPMHGEAEFRSMMRSRASGLNALIKPGAAFE